MRPREARARQPKASLPDGKGALPLRNWPSPCPFPFDTQQGDTAMGKGKMSGDNSADSKFHLDQKARGSGGTMKNRNDPGKQDNNKAQNTKSNRQ
jgi:hypothetical protein